MQNLNNKINSFFSNIDALASLLLRFGIGIAFIIHGMILYTGMIILRTCIVNNKVISRSQINRKGKNE